MDERDQRALGTRPRLLVDEPHAARPQLRERGADVFHAQRDVMEPRAALLRRTSRSPNRRRRLEQFERRTPPIGMKCARTRCDATSSGASTSSPSASR